MAKKPKADKPLTKMQMKFVGYFEGNATEAARLAGYKNPGHMASAMANLPNVKKALDEKQRETLKQFAVASVTPITVSRNEIINGLHKEAQTAERDSARVTAWGILADIFGLRIKANANATDLFAGWTDDQLDYYRRTGEIPPGVGSAVGPSASNPRDIKPPAPPSPGI